MADPESGYREATGQSLAKRRAAEMARYARTWRRMRWGRKAAVAGVSLTAMLLGSAFAALMFVTGPFASFLFATLFLFCIATALITIVASPLWFLARCPRCRGVFEVRERGRYGHCTRCGLPYDATHDPDRDDD